MKYYLGPYQTGQYAGIGPVFFKPPAGCIGSIDLRSIPDQSVAGVQAGVGIFVVPDGQSLDSNYRLFGQGDIRDIVPPESDRSVFASMLGVASVDGDKAIDWLYSALTVRADVVGDSAVKPLMPSTDLKLQIYLGGASPVLRRAFRLDMPEAIHVIESMKRQYRQLRSDARDGKLNDEVHHLRVLDAWGEKFKIARPQDVFVPDDLPKDAPVKHATTFTESFNTADSGTLGPDLAWPDGVGNWDIVSNQARRMTASYAIDAARTSSTASTTDHYAQCLVVSFEGVDGQLGPAARNQAADTFYSARAYNGDNKLYLRKCVGGTDTNLGAPGVAITIALPELYKISCNSTTLKSYQAGVERESITDSALSSGLAGGISGLGASSGGLVDDFETGDLVVASEDVSPLYRPFNSFRNHSYGLTS